MNKFARKSLIPALILVAAFMIVLLLDPGSIAAEPDTPATAVVEVFTFLPMVVSGTTEPAASYETDFTGTIVPWEARRWSQGPDFVIKHDDGCDAGECGFLDIKVNNSQAYVIASPMEAVQAPFTYHIKTRAKLLERNDGDAYGIIFGGNGSANQCPTPDFSTCFTEYYEFRVRYRDDNGEKFLEWKLKRVEGHDANNQNFGPDIIDWKRVDNVNPDSWVKWDIEVHNNGQMYIHADNMKQAGSAKDSTYIHNLYFGLMGRSSDSGGAHVLFDMFKIGT